MPSKDFMQIFYKEKDQIKGIDRYLLKTLLRVVMLLLTDVPGKQSRSCQFNIFLFVMLNKYGLTAFITSVSNALSAENSMYNQHHDQRICVCMNFYAVSITLGEMLLVVIYVCYLHVFL